MEVKGTAIKTIPEFVKNRFPNEYGKWYHALSDESKTIFSKRVSLVKWYPIVHALVEPTKLIGELFYNDIEKGAYELGVYSSKSAIKGIYKMLVKVSSPAFIVNRASNIMSNYYKPCIMDVIESTKTSALLSIIEFPEPDIVVDYRIYGWIKTTMEFSRFKNPKIELRKSMGKGDFSTDFFIEWQ